MGLVEYVKVCSLYGAGYYYMPGTDICMKLGGYVRYQFNVEPGQQRSRPVRSRARAAATPALDSMRVPRSAFVR